MLTADWPWTVETAWGRAMPQAESADGVIFPNLPITPQGATVTIRITRHHSAWIWELVQTAWVGTGYATPKAALVAACQQITQTFGTPCLVTDV